ncbi:proton-translocating NADH-quinone oxidoreductase, chain M [Beggiatoa alba B18LD]|uniref:NADH-quinone oxidoreductase subunit M n=1 Tax=Beggiatoa alba B18LD TaxID=395493 RepID=I3CGM2_9GAMM|nr:NADH-quinone oxidoreductase subunit M [Beggiatoa alba]EIJ42765.1 proton-translocating NADH-quinone oxidoreductase, chain M [Beggiatoa alba B18LD]
MFADLPLLSLLIWLPILGGFWVLAVGRQDNSGTTAKPVALAISIVTFVLSLPLFFGFDSTTPAMQFSERLAWIPSFNIYYHLGVDGISMPLIILTTFTTVLVVLAGWEVIQYKSAQYMASFLIMEGVMIGVFASLDAILFYVMFEAMLVPMFIIIGIWGGVNRIYATIKFFLYTFLGSVFMLVALLYLYSQSDSFYILDYHQLKISFQAQVLIFFAFFMAFAVKVPMWPVHTWLPDAHVEAPTGGSVILAAIMLKLGAYGFLRFTLPIVPDASKDLDWFMIFLSLVAVVYIGFVALVQKDMKKLIAYSSISHMGFVTLGFFMVFRILANTQIPPEAATAGAAMGIQGAMVQMISHGFISGAMFLCVGVLYDRLHSRMIHDYGGVANTMPLFAMFSVFFAMSNAGLPGTSGFVGEFLVILSAFKANFWIAFLAATTLILGAAYTLWMVKRVIFGKVHNYNLDHLEQFSNRRRRRAESEQLAPTGVATLHDLNARETTILAILAVTVLFFGIYPAPLLDVMQVSVQHLLEHISQSKLM